MPLFEYKVTLAGGKSKAGKITAKTEAIARERLSTQFQIVTWESIKAKPVLSQAAGQNKATKSPSVPAKPIGKTPTAPLSAKSSRELKPAPINKTLATVKPPSEKKNSKVDKLLFRQDGECFFCGRKLTKADASVEHLQPKSGGGKNDDGNVVACCITLNRTFGNMSLKEKFGMVLKKSGHFTCPALE